MLLHRKELGASSENTAEIDMIVIPNPMTSPLPVWAQGKLDADPLKLYGGTILQ
jgi:hypothetical protein